MKTTDLWQCEWVCADAPDGAREMFAIGSIELPFWDPEHDLLWRQLDDALATHEALHKLGAGQSLNLESREQSGSRDH